MLSLPLLAGKTQTRYSITGRGMMTERQSTVGGDLAQLRVQLQHGLMVAFEEVRAGAYLCVFVRVFVCVFVRVCLCM
jgi:hypothetical protein